MRRFAFAFFAACLLVSSAWAQPVRTFVASSGSDANGCLRTDPCRNFNAALAVVVAGGEVVAIDSAGYGPFSVAKAVSVIAPPGVHAAVAATSGDAVTINAPGGSVNLRGLYITSPGGAGNGITVTAATAVNIESCVVNGFSASGVSDGISGALVITDSTFRHLVSGVTAGAPAAGTLPLSIFVDHCKFEYCSFAGTNFYQGAVAVVRDSIATECLYGFVVESHSDFGAAGTASMTVDRSAASHNSGYGMAAAGNNGTVFMNVTGSVASENGTGIVQFGSNTVHVTGSMIVHNGTGVAGTVLSSGNNTIEDNGSNGTSDNGTVTLYSTK